MRHLHSVKKVTAIANIGIFLYLVAIGIEALFLGTSLAPAFAQAPVGCTGDPHPSGATGDPHNGFRNPDSGNPHVDGFHGCPGAKLLFRLS